MALLNTPQLGSGAVQGVDGTVPASAGAPGRGNGAGVTGLGRQALGAAGGFSTGQGTGRFGGVVRGTGLGARAFGAARSFYARVPSRSVPNYINNWYTTPAVAPPTRTYTTDGSAPQTATPAPAAAASADATPAPAAAAPADATPAPAAAAPADATPPPAPDSPVNPGGMLPSQDFSSQDRAVQRGIQNAQAPTLLQPKRPLLALDNPAPILTTTAPVAPAAPVPVPGNNPAYGGAGSPVTAGIVATTIDPNSTAVDEYGNSVYANSPIAAKPVGQQDTTNYSGDPYYTPPAADAQGLLRAKTTFTSDRRAKTAVRPVPKADVDGFLKAMGK